MAVQRMDRGPKPSIRGQWSETLVMNPAKLEGGRRQPGPSPWLHRHVESTGRATHSSARPVPIKVRSAGNLQPAEWAAVAVDAGAGLPALEQQKRWPASDEAPGSGGSWPSAVPLMRHKNGGQVYWFSEKQERLERQFRTSIPAYSILSRKSPRHWGTP